MNTKSRNIGNVKRTSPRYADFIIVKGPTIYIFRWTWTQRTVNLDLNRRPDPSSWIRGHALVDTYQIRQMQHLTNFKFRNQPESVDIV